MALNLLSKTPGQWASELSAFGTKENVLRAVRAVYRLETEEPWRLPDLGAALAGELERLEARPVWPNIIKRTESDDRTEKLLVETRMGAVETVLIPHVRTETSKLKMRTTLGGPERDRSKKPPRAAGCISTQVGCAVGCRFCASGLLGLARNLDAADMVAQALLLRRRARERGYHLATLVLMGMGEPLHNTENVLAALECLTDSAGGELGASLITVSTIGVLEGIAALARLGRQAPNLALSLHAPDDETRARIVPMKNLARARDALAAAREFARATRRFVTVSYVLLDGVNDSLEQASALAELLEGTGFHVNLLPWNAVPELPFAPTPRERAQEFWERLRARGVAVHFRKARGADARAACGQLRRQPT